MERVISIYRKRYQSLRDDGIDELNASPVLEEEKKTEELVEVGIVGPAHGVRGEFKVQPLTDTPEKRLGQEGTRWLQAPRPKIGRATPPRQVELSWGRSSVYKGREVWIVKLTGIDSPEEVSDIRGHRLLIHASDRELLDDEDEFYVQQLVGLDVKMQEDGSHIGVVVDVLDGTGTHDVLRIEMTQQDREDRGDVAETSTAPPRRVLLPFVKEMVPVVEMDQNVMYIIPPEGLFDVYANPATKATKNKKKRRWRRRPKSSTTDVSQQQ